MFVVVTCVLSPVQTALAAKWGCPAPELLFKRHADIGDDGPVSKSPAAALRPLLSMLIEALSGIRTSTSSASISASGSSSESAAEAAVATLREREQLQQAEAIPDPCTVCCNVVPGGSTSLLRGPFG